MQGTVSTHTSSHCGHATKFEELDNGLGRLFRKYGEKYIKVYKPDLVGIKLIRSIRLCRTPALGGFKYTCKGCGDQRTAYHSCGNSRCPKCQGVKRMVWQEKVVNKLYDCPYQHIVFTLPQELRGLAKRNSTQIYNCLLKSAWTSLKNACLQPNEMRAVPGAIMVLHTFGSDLKYHVHVHALVTFGGINSNGKWCWPKRKNKIVAFRAIRGEFRKTFLKSLKEIYPQLDSKLKYEEQISEIEHKEWCVHQEPPTANAKTIAQYLAKYINRIGLSIQRFNYDEIQDKVTLVHKDYNGKKDHNEACPTSIKQLDPLVAIDQILQHSLPANFHKVRYNGIHSSAVHKKYKEKFSAKVKTNGQTVKTIIQLVSAMMGYDISKCQKCESTEFDKEGIAGDKAWVSEWLRPPFYSNKDPTTIYRHRTFKESTNNGNGRCMPKTKKNTDKSNEKAVNH